MSRTDKTKPVAVRMIEHPPLIAEHNHQDGICDLPPTPLHDQRRYHTSFNCYWMETAVFGYRGCCHGCGCRLCTGHWERREERRRSRHQARRQGREMVKTWQDLD